MRVGLLTSGFATNALKSSTALGEMSFVLINFSTGSTEILTNADENGPTGAVICV